MQTTLQDSNNMTTTTYKIEDATFLRRLTRSVFTGYLAYILILVFLGGVFTSSGYLFSIYVCLGVFAFIVIGLFLKNIYFLESVSIDPQSKSLTILILKYNEVYYKSTIPINEIQVELFERRLMYKSFYLIISSHEKRIIKQPTVGGWRKKIFEDIIKAFNGSKTLSNSD
jgi:hypothetical protein